MSRILDREQVLKLFALYAGMSGAEAADWEPVCEGAAAELERRLRPGAGEDPEDLARLHAAAGGLACAENLLAVGHRGEVKVGEITLREGSGPRDPGQLRDYFLDRIADLLVEGDPVFRGIGGEE